MNNIYIITGSCQRHFGLVNFIFYKSKEEAVKEMKEKFPSASYYKINDNEFWDTEDGSTLEIVEFSEYQTK